MEGTEIRPFGPNVLIRPILKDDKVGGIYLPDSKDKPTLKGEVVSIGKDAYEELFVGQIVYYEKYSGNEVREGLILIPCTDLSGGEFSTGCCAACSTNLGDAQECLNSRCECHTKRVWR